MAKNRKKWAGKKWFAIFFVGAVLASVALFSLYSLNEGDTKNAGVVKIATKPMTEQFIIGEMLSLLIQDRTNLTVELTKGVGGGTANIQPALLKGDFDMYPEYTGTGWLYVLKKTDIPEDKILYDQLVKEYYDNYKLQWVGLYGFNNTYGLVVQNDIAQKYNISTYSDLAKNSKDLVFGAEYDFFEREDGYNALKDAYNFEFKNTVDLDIGLKYDAIDQKQIDVMNIFTTDGRLSTSPVKVLIDDKKFYENYYCGTVVREDTLKKNPELKPVLELMNNLISEQEMAKMNYDVEGKGMDEKAVAKDFLVSKGLL